MKDKKFQVIPAASDGDIEMMWSYAHSVDITLSSSETLQKEALERENLSLKLLRITAAEDESICFKLKNMVLLAAFANHQNCLLIYFRLSTSYQIQYLEMKATTCLFLMYMELIPLKSIIPA